MCVWFVIQKNYNQNLCYYSLSFFLLFKIIFIMKIFKRKRIIFKFDVHILIFIHRKKEKEIAFEIFIIRKYFLYA